MPIKLVDLTKITPKTQTVILDKISALLRSGDFILGKDVTKFEKAFAGFIGTKYAVGVASGTDAILLSLKALGVGPGDEVIVPTMTFIASVTPIMQLGARPVFIDSLPDHPNMDSSAVEDAITQQTKGIIAVHLHGYPVDLNLLQKLANKYNIFLLEDSSQAHGSYYHNKRTGSIGTLGTFSFYPSKNLGAFGDAGAVTTNNQSLYQHLLSLHNHGQQRKYIHNELGYNSRLDTIQAIVLNERLKSLESMNRKRNNLVIQYEKSLEELPMQFLNAINNTSPAYHNFVILTKKRSALAEYLRKKEILTGIHYPLPLHLQPALVMLGYKKGDFPNAERYAQECLSLPLYPELTQKEQNMIIRAIKSFFK